MLTPTPHRHHLLVPVISRFIKTFSEPSSESTKDFWGKIVHHQRGGSGQPDYYSGWLNAFSFWNENGYCMYTIPRPSSENGNGVERLKLDGVTYHRIRPEFVTQGWVSVDIEIDESATGHGIYVVEMFAGSVGMDLNASGDHGQQLDTVKPVLGWWVYLKDSAQKPNTDSSERSIPETLGAEHTVMEERRLNMWRSLEVEV